MDVFSARRISAVEYNKGTDFFRSEFEIRRSADHRTRVSMSGAVRRRLNLGISILDTKDATLPASSGLSRPINWSTVRIDCVRHTFLRSAPGDACALPGRPEFELRNIRFAANKRFRRGRPGKLRVFSRWSCFGGTVLPCANNGYAILAIEPTRSIEPMLLLGTPGWSSKVPVSTRRYGRHSRVLELRWTMTLRSDPFGV